MAETLAAAALGPQAMGLPDEHGIAPSLPPEDMPSPQTPVMSDDEVLRAVRAYKDEADQARQSRMKLNERNWLAYYGQQDFSGKLPGQSREVIPKVSESVEALAAFVKRGLTEYGNWFSVKVPNSSPIPAAVIQK